MGFLLLLDFSASGKPTRSRNRKAPPERSTRKPLFDYILRFTVRTAKITDRTFIFRN